MAGKPLTRLLGATATLGLAAGLLCAAIVGIFCIAPTEQTMGQAQKILYVHVAVAWFSLAACLAMGLAAIAYLATRKLAWDHLSFAAAEVGWLCCTLTLITGSLWARTAWNTWWTWEPRLTAVFVLWTLYSGYLLVRSTVKEPHGAARAAAVLAIVGLLDLPLVLLATRWFRGMHPPAPEMDAAMSAVLWLSILGFGAFFALLLVRRKRLLELESLAATLEEERIG